MDKLISEGKCIFCDKKFAQQGITRHLHTHLKEEVAAYKGKKQGMSFLVKAKANEMFLMLWVDGQTPFEWIDNFFRNIWLECCGHMSSFTDTKIRHREGNRGFMSFDEDDFPGRIDMNSPIYKTYSKNKKLLYEYDFGSTTAFDVILLNQFDIPAPEPIVLLTRNEPLEILCHQCGKKPAVDICTVHMWEAASFFCKECAKKHEKECEDFADYAALPVVNSPRMGICAYQGGQIDLERNGIYHHKTK